MHNILRDILAVKQDENVLVMTDDISVGKFFCNEANEIGAFMTLVILPDEVRPLKHISKPIQSAIQSSNVVITAFRSLPQEISFRKDIISTVIKTHSARLAHMPNVDLDVITNCILDTDFDDMGKLGKPLIEVLARAKEVRITSNSGSDISLDLGGWTIPADAGGLNKIDYYGAWDNLPTGEVFKVPKERTANGKLVIDGAIPGKVLSKDEPLILHISKGMVVKIDDRSTSHFEYTLKNLDSQASDDQKGGIYKVCEFGIGINRNARKVQHPVEYEKRLGTAHIALGDNRSFDGNINAPDHLDLMFESPTIYVNGVQIMRGGNFIQEGLNDVCANNLETYKTQRRVKITDKSRLLPTTKFGTSEIIDNSLLYRKWIGPGEMLFRTMVGDIDTSKIAAKAWIKIKEENTDVESLVNSMSLSKRKCLKLIRMLHDFGLIEVVNEE